MENCVKTLAYCDGTYWSLVADINIYTYIYIYHCTKEENCVKTYAYCEGMYWSLAADIYLYI